jgi:hypothetical protein
MNSLPDSFSLFFYLILAGFLEKKGISLVFHHDYLWSFVHNGETISVKYNPVEEEYYWFQPNASLYEVFSSVEDSFLFLDEFLSSSHSTM